VTRPSVRQYAEREEIRTVLDLPTFLTFYAAVLKINLSPGPDMVMVVGVGSAKGAAQPSSRRLA